MVGSARGVRRLHYLCRRVQPAQHRHRAEARGGRRTGTEAASFQQLWVLEAWARARSVASVILEGVLGRMRSKRAWLTVHAKSLKTSKKWAKSAWIRYGLEAVATWN